jgi:hypothetical protein
MPELPNAMYVPNPLKHAELLKAHNAVNFLTPSISQIPEPSNVVKVPNAEEFR